MTRLLLACAFAMSILSCPVVAQQRDAARPVGDRATVTLNPEKAYLLVESEGPVTMMLIREPTQAEQEQWVADRAEELARAQRRYVSQMRRYEADLRLYRSARANRNSSVREPERPVEPTDATFQFTPIELRLTYSFGPQNRFAKASGSVMLVTGRSVYLTELPPGTYHVYGPVMMAPNGGAAGTCLCMGTVSFEMAAGQITNLGQVINPLAARAAGFGSNPVPAQTDPDTSVTVFGIEPARAGATVDPRLSEFTIVPAQLRPGRRFANWFGLTVDRISPVPGVIGYRRDQVIDLTSATGSATPEEPAPATPAAAGAVGGE